MKQIKLALLALSVSAASFSTLAADSAVVNVKGSVAPAACNITVDGNADYGMKSVADLKHAGIKYEGYQLGIKSVPFTVQCNTSALTGVKVIADDLGAGSSSPVGVASPVGVNNYVAKSDSAYAQLKDGETLLGYYAAAIGNFNVDGTPANRIISSTQGATWTGYDNGLGYIGQTGTNVISWSTGLEAVPTAAETVTGILAISAALIPETVDAIKDNVSFNTNTTLQLSYL